MLQRFHTHTHRRLPVFAGRRPPHLYQAAVRLLCGCALCPGLRLLPGRRCAVHLRSARQVDQVHAQRIGVWCADRSTHHLAADSLADFCLRNVSGFQGTHSVWATFLTLTHAQGGAHALRHRSGRSTPGAPAASPSAPRQPTVRVPAAHEAQPLGRLAPCHSPTQPGPQRSCCCHHRCCCCCC